MKLALAFQTPLHVLMQLMSSEEYTLWQAFDEEDPISLHHRIDLAGGVIASTSVNRHISDEKKLTKPIDFMPVLNKQEEKAKPNIDAGALRSFFREQIAKQESRKAQQAKRGEKRSK